MTEETKNIKSRKTESATRAKLKRKSLRRRGPLSTESIPGYNLRWANDQLDRLVELQESYGYEFVLDDKGHKISRTTRQGDEIFKVYLMKQPLDIHEELKAEKRAYNKTLEANKRAKNEAEASFTKV